MKTKTRKQSLKEACEKVGYRVATYSPGDGITRYRFFSKVSKLYPIGREVSYFEADGEFTALGYREACIYARAKGAFI